MDATNPERSYVIEVLIDEQRGWEELYRAADRVDADQFWRGMLVAEPGKPARLVESEIVRTYPGHTAATPPQCG